MNNTSAGNEPEFRRSSSAGKSAPMASSSSAGTPWGWIVVDENATIDMPQIRTTAGSMFSSVPNTDPLAEELDEIDAEIAIMSESEIMEAVLASAGAWADRDDLDGILDRRDRIDELYAPFIPNDPDPSI
jgi:hypothetical protein